MRTSAHPTPRPVRRETAGSVPSPAHPVHRSPIQLELFKGGATAPRTSPPRALPRPTAVPNPRDPEAELCRRLNRLVNGRLRSVTFTDNRRTILSVRPGRPGDFSQLALRIHRCFHEASDEVLQSVAVFLESKKGSDRARQALAVIREQFNRHRTEAGASSRRANLRPIGSVLDLRKIYEDLNERYFEGRLAVDITWGKGHGEAAHRCRPRRARTATLQLGSYSYEDRLIRVHRVLDEPGVPRYVVESVVFHELVHADLPPVVRNGRRHFHTPEFRRREREFRHIDKADQWIQEHLPELLQARHGVRGPRRRS